MNIGEGVNRVILLGNLGCDPILKGNAGGPMLRLRVGTREYFMKNKVRRQRIEWHLVTIWGPRAEALARYLIKGDTVYVDGRIKTRTYQRPDGEWRYATDIIADDVIVPDSPRFEARFPKLRPESNEDGDAAKPEEGEDAASAAAVAAADKSDDVTLKE